MEILLILALGGLAWVLIQNSRGKPVDFGTFAGGCLGLGCLGTIILLIASFVVLWLILQAIGDIDISLLDEWFDENRDAFDGGGNGGGGGGGGNRGG
jgi:hypothetical protein